MACNSSGGTGTHLRFSATIECVYKKRNMECSTDIPFFDESCGGLAALSTRSFPLLLEGDVIELPTSGQLSLSSTGGMGLDDCELRGLMTKGSPFSEPRVEAPLAERMGRKDTAPSRNPELVLGSRSCDATDGGGSFARGMAGDLCVVWLCAICSLRKAQTFTGGWGGVTASEAVRVCPLSVGACPLTDNVELVSADCVDELEVDGCRIEGAGGLGECLGLCEGTFIAVVGLEGPEVLAGERVLAETPFTGDLLGELSFLVRFLARSAYESGAGLVVVDWG